MLGQSRTIAVRGFAPERSTMRVGGISGREREVSKVFHRALLGLVALAPLFPHLAIAADYDAARKAAVGVVRVIASTPGARDSFGSGVALPDGRVATNCHVTRNASSIAVVADGTHVEVQEEIGDAAADVCVLRVARLNTRAAKLDGSRNLQIGDEVTAVGFSGGFAKSISPGKVTALFPYRGGYVIRTTAAFRAGASGGGLFDRNGKLVGLITFYRRGPDGFAFFAVPVEWIDQLQLTRTGGETADNPFWMLPQTEQPRFLRVATFEADGNWREMAAAAREWTQEEPGAAQAWDALGRALINLGERTEGTAARERAQRTTASLVGAAL